jgi:uncharacterized protein YneF (UPF0154 family)
MSLINQALHKAQRDRKPNRMPEQGEPSTTAYANNTASGMSPAIVIGLIITVAVLIGLVIGLSITVFRDNSSATQQIAANPTAPQTTAQQSTNSAEQTNPELSHQNIAYRTPIAESSSSSVPGPSLVQELRKAREDAEAKAALATEQALAAAKAAEERAKAAAQAAELAAARAAAKPSQDIIEWLGNATLSGVRISETSSKLILNGKAYSPGEYVNFSLGIKVMVIQENRVLFTDNMGKKYMKRL